MKKERLTGQRTAVAWIRRPRLPPEQQDSDPRRSPGRLTSPRTRHTPRRVSATELEVLGRQTTLMKCVYLCWGPSRVTVALSSIVQSAPNITFVPHQFI